MSEIQKKSQLNYWTDQLTIYLVQNSSSPFHKLAH